MSLAVLAGTQLYTTMATQALTIPGTATGIIVLACAQSGDNRVTIGGQLLPNYANPSGTATYCHMVHVMSTEMFEARSNDNMVWDTPGAVTPDIAVLYVTGNPDHLETVIFGSSGVVGTQTTVLAAAPNGSNLIGFAGASRRCVSNGGVDNNTPTMTALYDRQANNHHRCGAYRVGSDDATLEVSYITASCSGVVGGFFPAGFSIYDADHDPEGPDPEPEPDPEQGLELIEVDVDIVSLAEVDVLVSVISIEVSFEIINCTDVDIEVYNGSQ